MQELLILCALEEEFSKEDNRYAESIFYTGVGKVNSCIAAMELIKERDPTLVVNVGTAGSCRHGIEGIIECGVLKIEMTQINLIVKMQFTQIRTY